MQYTVHALHFSLTYILYALQGCYSWEADLWSIGVITYILLSGFPPFWGSSDYMIFQRILENDVVSSGRGMTWLYPWRVS